METVLEFLENEKEAVLDKIKEYAESGNTYSIGTSNEKLKYLNTIQRKSIVKLKVIVNHILKWKSLLLNNDQSKCNNKRKPSRKNNYQRSCYV